MNADKLAGALRLAFNLGQTYWRQADSEYPWCWEKADATRAKFDTLVAETLAEHDAQPAQAAQPKTLAIFTANQAQMLLDSFGGSPATYALIDCKAGECAPLDDGSPSPAGLYVYDLNCPEEGVIYLGDEDEDSEPRSEQPEKPPFVLERWGFPVAQSKYRLERMADGYWTPWHIAQQALADTRARMQYEFDKARAQAAQPVGVPDVGAMVDRFLSWPLPKDFAPDCWISFRHTPDARGYAPTWPIGTNLFTADQAKAMFEYVLAGKALEAARAQEPDAARAAEGDA